MSQDKFRFYQHQIDRMLSADMFLLYQELERYSDDLPKLYEMFEIAEFIREHKTFTSEHVSNQIKCGEFDLKDPYFAVIDYGVNGSLYSFDDLELDNFLLAEDLVDAIMSLTDEEIEEVSMCGLRIEPYEEHVRVPLSLMNQIVQDYEAIDKDYNTYRQSVHRKEETVQRIKQTIQFNTED